MNEAWNAAAAETEVSDVDRLWKEVAEKTRLAAMPEISTANRLAGRALGWLQPARRYAVAAVLLVTCSISYYWTQAATARTTSAETPGWLPFAVENGTHGSLGLSDGSRVRLDARSTLQYPGSFTADERLVKLSGEAYFEVVPNLERPFVIHAADAVVEVLGTEFNVRAWNTEERVTVVVAEGTIALSTESGLDATIKIGAGQMSILPKAGQPAEPTAVVVEHHLA